MVVTKFLSCQGYLPFTWHNQTFQLENQVDRHIPFGKFQTMQCLYSSQSVSLLLG